MNVFIVGIHSFIGKELTTVFHKSNFKVYGSVSSKEKKDDLQNGKICENVVINFLEESFELEIPEGIEVVIYTAHVKDQLDANLVTNRKIYERTSQLGAKHHIFLSSISASKINKSKYGQIKMLLEDFFKDQSNTLILNPGLVIGNGGLYKNIESFVKNHSIIPLPDGGIYPMASIQLRDLCLAILKSITEKKVGHFYLYEEKRKSLKEMVNEIAKRENKKVIIIPIPTLPIIYLYRLLSPILKLFNAFSNFNVDSVAGYRLYKYLELPKSNIKEFIK